MKRTTLKPTQRKVKSSKQKGRRLQNWAAKKISQLLDIPWGPDELISSRRMGQKGVDVVLRGAALEKFPYSIECASGEKINLLDKIRQARKNRKKGLQWLLFFKRAEFKTPIVMMDADVFFNLIDLAHEHGVYDIADSINRPFRKEN